MNQLSRMDASDVATPYKLLVFAYDAAEAAQRRRIRAYQECGFDVTGFTMRRANMTHDADPFWRNIDLGETRNAAMGQRIRRIIASMGILWKNRDRLAGSRTIVARNLDMLIVAAAARQMIRPRPRMVYEALDIHDIMTDAGRKGRLARAVERGLLRQTESIIISSMAFQREYFAPMQGWAGKVRLVENKMWVGDAGPARPRPEEFTTPVEDRPLVLGWVGSLRCPQSLEILLKTAERMGSRVRIEMHGNVHRHILPDFDDMIARHENVTYHGAYAYPEGLEAIYRGCDMVWAQDLWQWGTNSNWLLPNRIYEAGYFGCPSIAVEGTETGRRVADGLGWTVPEPSAEALVRRLEGITVADALACRRAILGMPDEAFRQSAHEIAAAVLS